METPLISNRMYPTSISNFGSETTIQPDIELREPFSFLNALKSIFCCPSALRNASNERSAKLLESYDILATGQFSSLLRDKGAVQQAMFASCQASLRGVNRTILERAVKWDPEFFSQGSLSGEEEAICEAVISVWEALQGMDAIKNHITPNVKGVFRIDRLDMEILALAGAGTAILCLSPLALPIVMIAVGGLGAIVMVYGMVTRIYRFTHNRKEAHKKEEWDNFQKNISVLLKNFKMKGEKVMWARLERVEAILSTTQALEERVLQQIAEIQEIKNTQATMLQNQTSLDNSFSRISNLQTGLTTEQMDLKVRIANIENRFNNQQSQHTTLHSSQHSISDWNNSVRLQ